VASGFIQQREEFDDATGHMRCVHCNDGGVAAEVGGLGCKGPPGCARAMTDPTLIVVGWWTMQMCATNAVVKRDLPLRVSLTMSPR
jgi:hypothetical protein